MSEVKLDYLSGTLFAVSSEENAIRLLQQLYTVDERFSFDNWEKRNNPLLGYTSKYQWIGSGFYVAYTEARPDMKVFVTMGGSDIDLFGSEVVKKIMVLLSGMGFKASRVDLAFDIFEDDGTVQNFRNAFKEFISVESPKKVVVSRMLQENFKMATAGIFEGKGYENWTIGSRNASKYYRFYDKRVEQKLRKREIENAFARGGITDDQRIYLLKRADYWFRIEVELKHGATAEICDMITSGTPLGAIFAAVMESSFRIVAGENENERTAYREENIAWYQALLLRLQNCDFVQLPKPIILSKKVYSTLQWLLSCSPIIATYKMIKNKDIDTLTDDEQDSLLRAYCKPHLRFILQSSGIELDSFGKWSIAHRDAFDDWLTDHLEDIFFTQDSVIRIQELSYGG